MTSAEELASTCTYSARRDDYAEEIMKQSLNEPADANDSVMSRLPLALEAVAILHLGARPTGATENPTPMDVENKAMGAEIGPEASRRTVRVRCRVEMISCSFYDPDTNG